MRRRWFVGAVLVLTVAACSEDESGPDAVALGAGTHPLELDWSGGKFDYVLDVPAGYDPDSPVPLVLVMHGSPGTAAGIREESQLGALPEPDGALVAYPDQERGVAALRELVTQLSEAWSVAPGQVYAAGFSAGGSAAYRLAIQASDVFAAIAAVSAPYRESAEELPPAEAVSLLAFVGEQDGAWLGRIDDGLATWREALDCPPGEPTWVDEHEVSLTTATCADGSEVAEYRFASMGHSWPRAVAPGMPAVDVIWEFFADHAR